MKFSEALKLVLDGKTIQLVATPNHRIRAREGAFERWGTHFQVPRWYTDMVGTCFDFSGDWIEYIESFDFFEAIKRIEKGEKVRYQDTYPVYYLKDGKVVYNDGIGTYISNAIDPRGRFVSVP